MSNTGIKDGQPIVIGSAINVRTLAELAKLDVSSMTLGTVVYVYDQTVAQHYKLQLSFDTIDHVDTEAVDGYVGLRWKRVLPDVKLETELYVSPFGDNVYNDGKSWRTPLKTVIGAIDKLAALIAAGKTLAGTIRFADMSKVSDGTEGGGVVDGQGLWLFDPPGPVYLPRGFRRYIPFCLIGDKSYTIGGFNPTGRARLNIKAVATDRFRSTGLWLVGGCTNFNCENAQLGNGADPMGTALRMGWDFARNSADPNFGPLLTNITSASRANGKTTFTLAPLAPLPVLSASRSGNVTSLVIDYAAAGLKTGIPWSNGNVPFTFNSTNGAFPGGAKTQTILFGQPTYAVITYADPGPDIATTLIPGSTVVSHGMAKGDSFDMVSNTSEFPSTFFGPITSTIGTDQVVCPDPYGSTVDGIPDPNPNHHATVTVANPGQYVQQLRQQFSTALNGLRNIQGGSYPPNLPDQYWTGPAADIGNCAAGDWLYHTLCSWVGLVLDQPGQKVMDFRREAAILVDGGAIGPAGFTFEGIRTQNGGLVYYRYPGSLASIHQMMQDTDVSQAPPTVHIIARSSGLAQTMLYNVQAADVVSDDTHPVVLIEDTVAGNTLAEGCGMVVGPHIGAGNMPNVTKTLPGMGASGFWGADRIAGDHAAARVTGGPKAARFRNIIGGRSEWTLANVATTITSGIDDPFGGTGAYRIAPVVSGGGVYLLPATTADRTINGVGTVTHSIGDFWAYGIYIRRKTGNSAITIVMEIGPAPVGYQLNLGFDAPSSGVWEWFKISGYVDNVPDPHASYRIAFLCSNGADLVDIYQPRGAIVPVSAGMQQSELGQFFQTMAPQDRYLLPGVVGTLPNQPLIAHGGLGTANAIVKTIGAASGQVTLGTNFQVVPELDETGVQRNDGAGTPLWRVLAKGTVNP